MNTRHKIPVLLLASALAGTVTNLSGQVFSDNFDSNTSASWTAVGGSSNGTNDFSAQFAFDYGTNQITKNGATMTIPSAPNSGGTTKGLRVAVNKDAVGASAVVSLYPNGQNFSGNYSLKFDMWANYNGPAYGGAESTEFISLGLNHAGDKANWTNSPSDGVYFFASTEGGAAPDFRGFVGTGGNPAELLDVGFFDRDGDFVVETNTTAAQSTNFPLKLIFPSPQFESAGAPGKEWVEVELRQIDGMVTWLMNGFVIAEHNQALNTSGNIMLGYADIFAGVPNPKEDSFVIFDNVRVFENPTLRPMVTAVSNGDATETSGNIITITRTGSTAQSLVVPYSVFGTARSGVDYTALSGSATIPAGQTSVDIAVTPINDNLAEPAESIVIALKKGATYDVGGQMMATVNIQPDGGDTIPVVSVTTLRSAYELSQLSPHRGKIEFSIPAPLASDLTVNYTLSGTATNGVHYLTIPTSITILAGETNAIREITAINDAVVNADRTIIVTLADSSSTTALIRNDDLPVGTLLFSDNFETDSSANWTINRTKASDPATFAFDYGVNTNDIPAAPNSSGTTKGLKIEVNVVTAGALAGISVSPKNQSFTGDYRLRFDAWINYNGAPMADGGSQSTEWLTAGLGTSGNQTQWYNGGSAVDGVWVAVDGDGGNGLDYRIYRGNVAQTVAANPGVYALGSQRSKDAFETSAKPYAFFGGERPPLGQRNAFPTFQNTPDSVTNVTFIGNAGFAWHDYVITLSNGVVTWHMDGVLIASVPTNGVTMSSNIFVGSFDASTGVNPAPGVQYAIIDNLRVESLNAAPPTAPSVTSVSRVGGNIQIDFSGATTDAASAFSVEAKATVTGTFAPEPASITQLSPGSFRATIPLNGDARFYRIKR